MATNSRLRRTPTLTFDGQLTYGSWRLPDWMVRRPGPDQVGVLLVTPELEGRPDRIADQLYGDPGLDWVLMAFNRADAVLNWPAAGATIEYPSDSVVIPAL